MAFAIRSHAAHRAAAAQGGLQGPYQPRPSPFSSGKPGQFNAASSLANGVHANDNGDDDPKQVQFGETGHLSDGSSHSSEEEFEDDNAVKQLVRMDKFQWFVGFVILFNTLVMSLEADYPKWENWWIFDNCLLVFFVTELALRLYTFRCTFFTNKERWWNIFDLCIVVLGVLDLWVFKTLFGHVHKKHAKVAKFVTVLRVVRILRILRLLRLLKAFKDLYLLAVGLVMSVRVVFWITIFFFILIVVSAIFCTTMIGHEADMWDPSDREKILFYWGTVPQSMKTLFQFVTLDNWAEIAYLVRKKEPYMQIAFILYIFVTSFTILSLMTGVVSEHILTVANEDQEVMKKQHDQALKVFMQQVGALFQQADTDHSGTISRDEFKKILEDKMLHKRLLSMGIEVFDHDLLDLFDCLDNTGDEELTHSDFCDGFIRFQGQAKAKDLLKVQGALTRCGTKVADMRPGNVDSNGLSSSMVEFNSNLDSLEKSLHGMGHRMTCLEKSVSDFNAFMGKHPTGHEDDADEEVVGDQ